MVGATDSHRITIYMRKENKHCIDCGKKGVKERRRCLECYTIYNRARVREYYLKNGRHSTKGICIYCNKEMKKWRKNQNFHLDCYRKFLNENASAVNNTSGHVKARQIARSLGLVIDNESCIHHINENPKDNDLSNLLFMTKKDHGRLHGFLRRERSLWLKGQSKYSENCWDTLRVHLTTAWLETTSAKVIKLNEIGQSASEHLSSEKNKMKVQRPCTEVLSSK